MPETPVDPEINFDLSGRIGAAIGGCQIAGWQFFVRHGRALLTVNRGPVTGKPDVSESPPENLQILPDDGRRGASSWGCSRIRRSRRGGGHDSRRCRFAPFDGCCLYAACAQQSYCPNREKYSDHCAFSWKLLLMNVSWHQRRVPNAPPSGALGEKHAGPLIGLGFLLARPWSIESGSADEKRDQNYNRNGNTDEPKRDGPHATPPFGITAKQRSIPDNVPRVPTTRRRLDSPSARTTENRSLARWTARLSNGRRWYCRQPSRPHGRTALAGSARGGALLRWPRRAGGPGPGAAGTPDLPPPYSLVDVLKASLKARTKLRRAGAFG
jgi:hypothetical protein